MVSLLWCVFSFLVGAVVAMLSLRRKSVSPSGAIAGFLVLSLSILGGFRFGAVILGFFISSSKLTKCGAETKRLLEGSEYKHGGQRDWLQVFANSSIATILILFLVYHTNWEDKCLDVKASSLVTGLLGGILGHYSCCNGDTWSSEIGVLSTSQPRLITTMRIVQHGVNGGITSLGLLAATGGGALIGLICFLAGLVTAKCEGTIALKQLLLLPIGAFDGLFGSLCDSLLGATMQYSGYCVVRKKVVDKPGPTVKRICGQDILNNNGVNFVSVLITTISTAAICLYVF